MKTAIKVTVVYLIIFLAGELVVRMFLPQYSSMNNGIGITGGIPFKLNSYGLRDNEFAFDKDGKYRILCLGDSITFGTQNRLENIYSKVLERLLNAGGDGRYQVINAGGVGGNTKYEYEYLKAKGIGFKPDYVVLGLCLNDVGDCYTVERNRESVPNFWANIRDFRIYSALRFNKNAPFYANAKVALNKLRWYLRTKSYLFSFIDVNMVRFMYKSGISKFSLNSYAEKSPLLAFGIDPAADRGWELLFSSLIDMRDYLDARGIKFLVVIFPFQFQLSDNIKDNFFNIDKKPFTINPQERITDFCRRNNIRTLDLLPYFQRSGKTLYFPLDYCHPTAAGHRIAADEIYKVLKDEVHV